VQRAEIERKEEEQPMTQVQVTKQKTGTKASMALRAGEPTLGAEGPAGGRFVGWVLVQVWEPGSSTAGADHNGVTVNWSGDGSALFRRAADELSKLSQSLP